MARSSGGEEEIICTSIDANKEYDKHGHWWWNKGKD